MDIYIEAGKKKVFAGAVDWPGWCRFGRDEEEALAVLMVYSKRYASALKETGIAFQAPERETQLEIVERHKGNVSTDFGAPAAVLEADMAPMAADEYRHSKQILSEGKELRKGPRGGGRDLDKIIEHVLEADRQYLRRLAWSYRRDKSKTPVQELPGVRQAILEALDAAEGRQIPDEGPRGGKIWPPRCFIRRPAWHVLDHAWEIEDRVVG
jgi:hypothetical protein